MISNQNFTPLSVSQHQRIRSLQKRSEREREQQCVLEGEHLCSDYAALVRSGQMRKPEAVVVNSSQSETTKARFYELAETFALMNVPVYEASEKKFTLLCDTQTPQGILAVIHYPVLPIETNKPMIILDGVADPGNVGTIIRTADWFGVRNILLGGGSADRFNPKTLRATMGSAFRCAVHSTGNLAETLQQEFSDYRLYGASLRGASTLEELDLDGGNIGIVMGSEAHGISPSVQNLLHASFRLASAEGSGAESLNVAVAAGIVLHCWRGKNQ